MQSVLSVPLIVTEQSFTASLLIRVSAIVTSSPNWSKHSWKEGENFFFFPSRAIFLSAIFSEPLQTEDGEPGRSPHVSHDMPTVAAE